MFVDHLGAPSHGDTPLFGCDVDPEVVFGDRLIPDVHIPMGSRYAIARVSTGVLPNVAFWLAPLGGIGQARVPWRQIVSLDDVVSEIAIHDDDLYLLTYRDAPRYKVVRTSVANPDLPGADVVVPETAAIIENIAAARDALYVQTLDSGTRRLLRIDYSTGIAEPIDVPNNGSAAIEVADTLHDGLLFSTSSWTSAPALLGFDPASPVARDTGLIPPLPVDMSGIETVVTEVPSHDGVMIPLVILFRQGTVRDGTRPALLSGYGAYGMAYASPWFRPDLLPWLERGGVYAVAGVRGGGEYGETWHLAGKEATKPNTWRDFIACAEYLVRERYTSPEHLAGEGTSAGGILIGNAIAERPDLFGAAIINVGLTNALRMETTANGVPNIPEFGSCATEEGFKALLAMDAFHKIRPGVRYPAVMLTHGITDPRVNPWFSAKMAARLQRASAADRAVLLRIDYDAGHGIGNTKAQRNSRAADTFAFLFDQLGDGL